MSRALVCCLFAALLAAPAYGEGWRGSSILDRVVEDEIAAGIMPGAVLLVGQGDRILHHRAYGDRSLLPARAPMRLDTVFDCASLTKVVTTAPAILMLVEEGRVRLDERVTKYLPDFARGESKITVRQLLTHSSGLRPDLDLEPVWSGYETGIEMAYREVPVAEPGARFIYSDINFILLAEIVRQLTGKRIDEFARERIFEPLGMRETLFQPPATLLERIAPTEKLADGTLLHGVVHDPTTRFMGGVAGHAGMFSTASDLARYCRMMLNRGRSGTKRILSPLGVAAMTRAQTPEGLPARGLGWDIDSPFASNRGDLFPAGSYGHTGYTGTSLWLDPSTQAYVVLMTNRVHPRVSTSVVSLRSRVASAVAAALDTPASAVARPAPAESTQTVLSGLDVLVRDGFAMLEGKRIGLITNRTGVDRRGRRGADLFRGATNLTLAAILTPEHGLDAVLDQEVIGDSTYAETPVYSLYQGDRRRPTAEMLAGLDALVFDIQDVGARFYTYTTTMAYAMEEAAKAGIPFYVLDRPNPITGLDPEGPVLDPELRSFIGYFQMPVRHAMTAGELALMYNEANHIGADLHVVKMEGWRRSMWFDQTGLPWIDPSPNIRTLNQALLYPGIAILEGLKNYSVGRGTDTPFEFVGASWMDATAVANELNRLPLQGVRVYAVRRKPESSHFAGEEIPGLQIAVTDRDRFSSLRFGLELASAIVRLHPAQVSLDQTLKLIGQRDAASGLERGASSQEMWAAWEAQVREFESPRALYQLYSRCARRSARGTVAGGKNAAPAGLTQSPLRSVGLAGGIAGALTLAVLGFLHPGRRTPAPFSATTRQAFERDDRVFDLLAFLT